MERRPFSPEYLLEVLPVLLPFLGVTLTVTVGTIVFGSLLGGLLASERPRTISTAAVPNPMTATGTPQPGSFIPRLPAWTWVASRPASLAIRWFMTSSYREGRIGPRPRSGTGC